MLRATRLLLALSAAAGGLVALIGLGLVLFAYWGEGGGHVAGPPPTPAVLTRTDEHARLTRPTGVRPGGTFTVTLDLAPSRDALPRASGPAAPADDSKTCADRDLVQGVEMTRPTWATVTFDSQDFANVTESSTDSPLSGSRNPDNYRSVEVPGTVVWTFATRARESSVPYTVLLAPDSAGGPAQRDLLRWDCVVRVTEPNGGLSVSLLVAGLATTAGGGAWAWWSIGALATATRQRRSPNVFLSYRREDAAGWTGRIMDRLAAEFGETHVFQDVVDIEGGAEWVEELHRKVEACDVLIALIGKRWTGGRADGTRRIDDPQDWVRLEVARALDSEALVIPVLVDGMHMSALGELPTDLTRLKGRNSIEVSAVNFDADMRRLIRAVRTSKRRGRTG